MFNAVLPLDERLNHCGFSLPGVTSRENGEMWLLNSPTSKIIMPWKFKLKSRKMFLLTYKLNYSFAGRRKLSAAGSVCIFCSISYHQILLHVTNWTFKYLQSFSRFLLFLHSVRKVMERLQVIQVAFWAGGT